MILKPFLSAQIFAFVMSASWVAIVAYSAIFEIIEGSHGN